MNTPTPITEAHYALRRDVIFSDPDQGAQLIADSEARAVANLQCVFATVAVERTELRAERDQLRAELAAERARLQKIALDACRSAQIKPLVWYPKGYVINPNDLGKINEHQVEACVAAIDAAMKEDAK